jgi:hypothetical protein
VATRVLTGTNRSIKRLIATLRAASFARGSGGGPSLAATSPDSNREDTHKPSDPCTAWWL